MKYKYKEIKDSTDEKVLAEVNEIFWAAIKPLEAKHAEEYAKYLINGKKYGAVRVFDVCMRPIGYFEFNHGIFKQGTLIKWNVENNSKGESVMSCLENKILNDVVIFGNKEKPINKGDLNE